MVIDGQSVANMFVRPYTGKLYNEDFSSRENCYLFSWVLLWDKI